MGGPKLPRTVRSLTLAQMYRPQIGLKLGMEKKGSQTPQDSIVVDDSGDYLTDDDGVPIIF